MNNSADSNPGIPAEATIFVAGHRGMVGAALVRALERHGFNNIVTRTRDELDLTDQRSVQTFFRQVAPQYVFLAAAKVGGIHANNTYPADFIYQNLMLECNVVNSAFEAGTTRLLSLGSSCIYPRLADQPMSEEALLTGTLEPTNEPYALAKIAGIKLCESYNRQHGCDFRSVMPTNLYGPGDNFDLRNSHVVPALMRKFHDAKTRGDSTVEIWGSGKPRREFLYVDDMAEASVFVMGLAPEVYQKHTMPMLSHINIGTGEDITIAGLAETMAVVVGYDGELIYDASKPDGAPRKLMNVDRLRNIGWSAETPLESGLRTTYDWFLDHQESVRGL